MLDKIRSSLARFLQSKPGKINFEDPDSLDLLCSIWILSCNDQNPIITYDGLVKRLTPPANIDIRQLVQSRRELFRPRVPLDDLAEFKKRHQMESLGADDVFRNQFRIGANVDQVPMEILTWGLEHIYAIRQARVEKREQLFRNWVPLLSILLAMITLLSTSLFQYMNLKTQEKLKYYEVELKPKEEGYSLFMTSLVSAREDARQKNHEALVKDLKDMESAMYRLEHFVKERNEGLPSQILIKFQTLSATYQDLESLSGKPEEQTKKVSEIASLNDYFRCIYTETLFKDQPANGTTCK